MKNNIKCPVGTQIQSVIFSKDDFTEKSAKSWAEHNNFKFGKVDIKENTIRLRQHNPFEYKRDSFRTIELTDGVKAVIGCPINKTSIKKPKAFDKGGDVFATRGMFIWEQSSGQQGKTYKLSEKAFQKEVEELKSKGYKLFEDKSYRKSYIKDGNTITFDLVSILAKGGLIKFGEVLKVKDIEDINEGDVIGFVYKEEGKTTYKDFGKVSFFDENDKWRGFDIDGFPFEFENKINDDEKNNPEFELKDIENSGTYWSLYKMDNKKMDNGGGVNNYTEAEKWWGNDLSLNQQKEYAKKHLKSFEYDELLGSTSQYSKRDRRQKFINQIWEKEGSPKSVLKGLYLQGGDVNVMKDNVIAPSRYDFRRKTFEEPVNELWIEYPYKPTKKQVYDDLKAVKSRYREGSEYANFTPIVAVVYPYTYGWTRGYKTNYSTSKENIDRGFYDETKGARFIYDLDIKKMKNGGLVIDKNWGNDGSTPSNNKDYNALYEMFPDNHTEAKAIWNQLSEKQKEGFLYDLRVTDAGSEHIEESWLEFVKASSYEDWLENATNWDEMKNGGMLPSKNNLLVFEAYNLALDGKVRVDSKENFSEDLNKNYAFKKFSKKSIDEAWDIYSKSLNVYADGGGVGEDKTRIANEIVKQLGGMGRLNIMTGAYNFIALPNGVSFRIKNPKANYVKVILNSMDEYDVEIGRIRGDSYKIVSEIKGIDVSGLKGFIERGTGMYLSLADGGGIDSVNYEESLNKLIEKADNEVVYLKERKNDLENNRVRPSKIIGTGFKPQYARKLAFEWLDEQILKNEQDLSFKKDLLKSLKEGKNIILYNLEGKGVIREVEQEGYVTVYYINGMHSAYKRETLDKIKSELNAVVEEVKPEYKFNVSEKVSIIDEPSSNKNNYFEVVGHENYNENFGWETKIKNINTGETVTMFENLLEKYIVSIPVKLPTRAETIEAIDGLTVMLDIEPDNNEYKQGIERLKEYLNSLPKESFSDLNNPKNINGFIYKPTGDMIIPSIYQGFQINYDSDNKIKSIELWGQENGIMYKARTWNSDVIGSVFNGDDEIEMFEEGAEVLVGGKADYMSLVDIAEMHKVSLDHILRQAKMGMSVEREHSNDTNKIVEIVKDHLVESPDYYTKLQKIESSFGDGGGVEGYWIDVPAEHNNLFYLRTLANTRGINQGVLQESGLYRYTFTNERDMDIMIAELNKLQNPDFRRDMPQNLNQLKNYIEVGKLLRVSYNRNVPQAVGRIKVIVQTQTNGFYMKDGVRVPSDFDPNDFKSKSWIEYPKANLITFSPFGFTIYAPDIRDKSKLIKLLQYEYVVGEQLEIAMNTEQSDTFLYNNAVKMMEFVNKVYDLSDTVAFLEGGKLTPCMFNNKLEYNFDKESVSCFINAKNTGRMLVLRRATEDYKGCWSLMSGGVDSGEVPDETIKREIQEELGVNLNYDTLNYINATKHPDRTHHYFELTVNEEFEPVLNPENDAYMWINMSELPSNTHPLLIKYIKSDILV
jgi:8-oxo-dGTP diphosphatase